MTRTPLKDIKKIKPTIDDLVEEIDVILTSKSNAKSGCYIPFAVWSVYKIGRYYEKMHEDITKDQSIADEEKDKYFAQTCREGTNYFAKRCMEEFSDTKAPVNTTRSLIKDTKQVKVYMEHCVDDVFGAYTAYSKKGFWNCLEVLGGMISIPLSLRRIKNKYRALRDEINNDPAVAPQDKEQYFAQAAREGMNHLAKYIIQK